MMQDPHLEKSRGLSDERNRKAPLQWSLISRLFTYTRPYRWLLAALLFFVVTRSAFLPLLTWTMGAVISGPIEQGNIQGYLWGTAGYVTIGLLTAAGFYFRSQLANVLGERVVHDLRREMFSAIMCQPMDFFSHTRQGRLISRFVSDVENVRSGIQQVVFVSLVQFGQMLISGALLAWYDLKLFGFLLCLTPVYLYLNHLMRKRLSYSLRAVQESFSRVTSSLAETVGGIRITQSMAREEVNASRFRDLIEDHARVNMDVSRTVAVFGPLLEFIGQAFIALLIGLGGMWVLSDSGNLVLADFVMFFFFTNLFLSPITVISGQYQQSLSAMAGAERVFRMLDFVSPEPESNGSFVPDSIQGNVEFKDICFSYNPGDPVLHDISFHCPAGNTLALVGATGSGKSSIINLLCGFYQPDSGNILIDHRKLASLDIHALRKHFGMVPQNSFLFEGTLRHNLEWMKDSLQDGEIRDAATRLGLAAFLDSLPDGLETQVGDEAGVLSSGERQLVCLLRAWLANPSLIIFDEATSAVDALSELAFQQAFEKLRQGRTTIIVAHRLSTIRDADQILVMQHGEIIERGTHDALMPLQGVYQQLYRVFETGVQNPS
jgi:ATP-binding cassette subfamily B protein